MVWYYIWYGASALCALIFAVKAYRLKIKTGLLAGNMFTASVAVNLLYMVRISANTYIMASVSTSLFFISLVILLFTLLHYVIGFTESKAAPSSFKKSCLSVLMVLAVLDAVMMIINIFYEVMLRYFYSPRNGHAIKYMYLPKPPFYVQLALCYVILVLALIILLQKIIRIPRIYRGRYSLVFFLLLLISIVNFLYVTEKIFITCDVTVIAYGFAAPLVYWNTFDYSSKSMLNSTRKMILEYMGTPMILFDYEGYVADSNKDMRRLFPVLNDHEMKITMMDFIQIGAFKELQNTDTDQVFEWYGSSGEGMKAYQCNFTCLKDEKGRMMGHLLIMKSMETERDMLTRLYSKQSFWSMMEALKERGTYPITVAVCNANSIGLINDLFGWTKGNEMIRLTADLLKENLPESAVIARMDDSDIAVGFAQTEQEYAVRLFEQVREQYRAANDTGINSDLEYGIAVIRDGEQTLQQAFREAGESLRTKKLMSESSQKSSQLDSLTQTLTESDYETEEHVERTREMATKLGRALNLSDAELGRLALLAVLHDIGKIAIPHSILAKPGKLTEEEWEVMKTHAEKGYRIANASKELQPIANYILHHHERWDGNGYPDALAGEDIPLLSRIITVVDSHDVMVHDRPYHRAMSQEAAVEELRRCSGSQFDPHIIDVFLNVLQNPG